MPFITAVNSNRIYGLDILRAAAILFVVFLHSIFLLPPHLEVILEYFVLDGVSIFFVLSGYLIGGILIRILEAGNFSYTSLLQFWSRRWLRTLPAYYFVLIVLICLPSYYTRFPGWHQASYYFLFIQNVHRAHSLFFMEAWSLSIEEWFYLLIPCSLLILALIRMPAKRSILFISMTVIILTLVYRYYLFCGYAISSSYDWEDILKKRIFTRLDSIMIGVVGAYLYHYARNFWFGYKRISFVIGILLLISMKILTELKSSGLMFFLCVPYFTINAMSALCLIPYLSEIKIGEGPIYCFITAVSVISYSMYLLNLSFVQGYVLRQIDFYTYTGIFLALRYLLFWIFTFLASALLYRFVERPFMILSKR